MGILNSRRSKLEGERSEQIRDLEQWHEEKVDEVRVKLKTDPSYHNPMISAALRFLSGSSQYSMGLYLFAVVFISFLLSGVTELIIYYVFHVVAVHGGDMFEQEMAREPDED